MDCSECQHHYSQNGKCIENKNNCLYYLEEPRGKMLRTNFSFTILADAETPVIKPGAIMKNTSEKLYKAYRKKMEWDMTYERLDKNLHSVAKGLGEFYLNGTR